MIFNQKSDLELLRKAINTCLRVSTIVNMTDEDESRLIGILSVIEDELGFGVKKEGPPTAHEMAITQELSATAKEIVRLSFYKEESKDDSHSEKEIKEREIKKG